MTIIKAKIKYLQITWQNGRDEEFPISFIISESIRGFMDGYNVLTEI